MSIYRKMGQHKQILVLVTLTHSKLSCLPEHHQIQGLLSEAVVVCDPGRVSSTLCILMLHLPGSGYVTQTSIHIKLCLNLQRLCELEVQEVPSEPEEEEINQSTINPVFL